VFMSVLMAWYGVNFVLGKGLHSYGFGVGGFTYVISFIALELTFVGFATWRRSVANAVRPANPVAAEAVAGNEFTVADHRVVGGVCCGVSLLRAPSWRRRSPCSTTPVSRRRNRLKDGVDYHPTSRLVLFASPLRGHRGPGPLVGPVLAAQWGYAPGFIWIVIGACLAGAVHDFVILLASVRQDGLSLPKNRAREHRAVFRHYHVHRHAFIIITILASIGIVVVNALSESAWGMFTIVVTIPAALITGFWMYKLRPGRNRRGISKSG